MTILVTLEVFSGRPNPRWVLGLDQEAEFNRLVLALAVGSPVPADERLGYRGFRVAVAQPNAASHSLIVSGGMVIGSSGTRVDVGRRVERFLLQTGQDHIDPALQAAIATQIDTR